jgi:hypothetical protein
MTANVVHPAELERMLQARVAEARLARGAMRRPAHPRSSGRSMRRPRGIATLVATTAMALGVATVWATHGGSFIDLTVDDTQITHNDAIFAQGGVGAGTGNFDPYLTLSPGGNVDQESGYNICSEPVLNYPTADCPDPQFDEQTGGDRTHELLASVIPVNNVGGTDYREFFLDSNDSGSDPFMSIEVIKIFLDNQPDLTDYDPGTETFGNDDGSAASVAWDLDGDGNQTILLNTQGLESGSGVSDISVLVPDDLFPADCFYGSTTCDTYVIFYTEAGGAGVIGNRDYNTTAGFEEWRIELLPVVNVSKTVDISLTRTFPWDVAKSADVESIDLFAGDTASIDWTVTATVGTPTDSDLTVSGAIDILNPTGTGFAIEGIDANIVDVEDVLTLGGVDTEAAVTCPGGLPQALEPGETLTCTYTASPSSATDGTNTATVTIETNEEGDTQEYSDAETVDFDLAVVDTVDACIEVTDDNATPADTGDDRLLDAELCEDESPGVFNFSTDVGPFGVDDCDSVTITNTAHTLTEDTQTTDSASDTVDVTCHELSVSKDAATSFTRDYDWDIAKTRVITDLEDDGDADPATLTLAEAQQYLVTYEITVTMTGFTDSANHVSGTITIDNPAPIPADDVLVSDDISGFGAADVDCDPGAGVTDTVDVPAEDSATCTYSADLPDGTDRINTATATLFDVDYTGTADVLFDENTTLTEVDECIDVTDDNGTPADTADDTAFPTICVGDLDGNNQFLITHTILIGPYECGEHTFRNTASFETTDDENDTDESGSASYVIAVDVPCPQGCTLTQGYWKTHNDSFWGGAPTDETWDLIGPSAENTTFFLSGQTYFQVMWTAPKGNAYYNLAHQYIAAQLNVLAGADDTAIATAFADATTLFNTYTPAQIGALKGNNAIRQQFIALAGTLGSYNEGLIGPGHCDEDGSTTQTAAAQRAVAVIPRRSAFA